MEREFSALRESIDHPLNAELVAFLSGCSVRTDALVFNSSLDNVSARTGVCLAVVFDAVDIDRSRPEDQLNGAHDVNRDGDFDEEEEVEEAEEGFEYDEDDEYGDHLMPGGELHGKSGEEDLEDRHSVFGTVLVQFDGRGADQIDEEEEEEECSRNGAPVKNAVDDADCARPVCQQLVECLGDDGAVWQLRVASGEQGSIGPSIELLQGLLIHFLFRSGLMKKDANVPLIVVPIPGSTSMSTLSKEDTARLGHIVGFLQKTLPHANPIRLIGADTFLGDSATAVDVMVPTRKYCTKTFHQLEVEGPKRSLVTSAVVWENAAALFGTQDDATSAVLMNASRAVIFALGRLAKGPDDLPLTKLAARLLIADAPVDLSTTGGPNTSLPDEIAETVLVRGEPQCVPGCSRLTPLGLELAVGLQCWAKCAAKADCSPGTAQLPFLRGPVGCLDDDSALFGELDATMAKCREMLPAALGPSHDASKIENGSPTEELLKAIGPMGIAALLRCRVTPGSTTAVGLKGVSPLSIASLLRAFVVPHEPGQALTVGARALAKHIHRDRSDSWWGPGGELKGTQAAKNANALAIVKRVLHGATWMNVHMLPHDIVAVEYRVPEGYGARWVVTPIRGSPATEEEGSGEGTASSPAIIGLSGAPAEDVEGLGSVEFRGFLEPPDPEGHSKGWRH